MSLKLPSAPQGTQEVVNYALQRAHSSGKFYLASAIGGSAVVTPVAPHQVYVIGLNDLAGGAGIKSAKLAGWRTIVLQGKNPVAAVEFAGGGAAHENFRSVNQGPQVQSTASAVTMAESIPQVKMNDFEMRLLQIPAIYLGSLWLHGSNEDLFIPLDPAPGKFKAYTLYSETDFFKLAAELARRRASYDDSPKGAPPLQSKSRPSDPEEPLAPGEASAAS